MQSDLPVLVVDDDPLSRRILERLLSSSGVRVESAASGEEALARLEGGGEVGVLVLDLVMPGVDGYELLRRLGERGRTSKLPVLVMTGLDGDEALARAFELGAADFVRKPVGALELVSRVRSLARARAASEALAGRERDARVVLELTQALASTLDLSEILFKVVATLAEVTRLDRCSVVLTRGDEGRAYVLASSDDSAVRDLPIELEKYPEIRRTLESAAPYVVDDVDVDPLFDRVRASFPPDGPKALACLPLAHDGRTVGALVLRSSVPHPLSAQELWVAKAVAGATSIALRNARLLESLREENRTTATARSRAERALRELEPYADFFRAAGDGLVVVGADGGIRYANPRASELLGATVVALEGARFDAWLVPAAARALDAALDGVQRGEASRERFDVRLRGDEGRARTLSVSSAALPDEGELLLSLRDVTEERRVADELRATRDFLELVIDGSADAIVSCDEVRVVRLFSRAAVRLFGRAEEDVVGLLSVDALFPVGVVDEVERLVASDEGGGRGRLEELVTEIVAADDARIPARLSAAWIVDDDGSRGWVMVLGDLREQQRLRAIVEDTRAELRAREQAAMMAELAGAAAHELNQPLTSVLAGVELLRRRAEPDASCAKELDALEAEALRMAEIVRRVGTITRYETKSYVGGARILDLERSSSEASAAEDAEPPPTPR